MLHILLAINIYGDLLIRHNYILFVMKKATDDNFYKVVIIICAIVCMSIIILNYNDMSHAQTLKKRDNENKTQFYGCGKYGQTIHCDPLTNKLESNEINLVLLECIK